MYGTVAARARGRVHPRVGGGLFAHAIAWLRQRDHPPAEGPSRVRIGVPDRSATSYRLDEMATALRWGVGPGPDGTRPPTCERCLPYAPGVVGQMKVLQFAKNVRESSLIISVAE